MRLSYLVVIALIAGTGVSSWASAKTLTEGSTPVNFPPANFDGRSFVDNDGCVYIRAGVDGGTQWVPRVTRSRQIVCGQQPTFRGTQVAAAPAARTITRPPVAADLVVIGGAPEPTQTAAAATPAAPVVRAPQPTQETRQVRRVDPVRAQNVQGSLVTVRTQTPRSPTLVPRAVQRVASAPVLSSPHVIISAPQPTVPSAHRAPVVSVGNCGRSQSDKMRVRCGPQTQSPSSGTRVVGSGQAHHGGRPIVRGAKIDVVVQAGHRFATVPPIPKNYELVDDDGRLNPFRGLPKGPALAQTGQTVGLDLAWTHSAPHVLYDRASGIVVSHQFPHLSYPQLPSAETVAPRAVYSTKTPVITKQQSLPTVRSRVVDPALPTGPTQTVQVAKFSSMQQAQAVAQQFANTGLHTRIGKLRSGGQVVVLGPFADAGDIRRALQVSRQFGFHGARVQ